MTGPLSMDADIARRIESLSPAKRGLLDLLMAGAGGGREMNRLVRRGPSYESVAPLSFVQEEWWLLDRMAPGAGVGSIQFQMRLSGQLDRTALTSAFDRIVKRHEILRTHVEVRSGQPRQVIAPATAVALEFVDLRDRPDGTRAREASRLLRQHANPPIEIGQPPLFRVALLRTGEEEHVLLLLIHHIVVDGWSMGVFFRQLASDYHAIVSGLPSSIADLPIQYADFACWQRAGASPLTVVRDLAYWKRQLAGVSRLRLPMARRPGAGLGVFDIAYEHRELPPGLFDAVRQLAGDMGATPFAVLLAAFAIVLHGLTGQDDIVISAPHAKRDTPELAGLIGSFAGYLILRTAVLPTDTFRTVVGRARSAVMDACAHGEAPFHRIVQTVPAADAVGFNPTQVFFNLLSHDQMYPAVDAGGVQIRMADDGAMGRVGCGFEIALKIYEWEQSVRAFCGYDPRLFDIESARALLDSYVRVLERCARHPDATVSALAEVPAAAAPPEASAAADRRQIAIASTFPIDGLKQAIGFWSDELNMPLDVVAAPTDQVFQQLLDPTSSLSQNRSGLNVLLLRLDGWQPDDVRKLGAAIRAFDRTAAPLFVCLCPPLPAGVSSSAPDSARLEALIETGLAGVTGVATLGSAALITRNGSNELVSARAGAPASIPYSPLFISTLGTSIVRALHARDRSPHKVLVVDGDDTLWSGAAGELGAEAVEIDAADRAVQEFVLAQHDAGMLVCLCSRNDEADVERVFERHPEMPLHRDHLAGWRVNSRSKSENLVSLAEELCLGLESFVFVDDDPVACAEVAANCPEVLCVPLPRSPEARASFLARVWAFDRWAVTAEDRSRTVAYRQHADRGQFREASITLADFLAGLHLKVDVTAAAAPQTVRMAQLLQRTRQFATSLRVRNESELQHEIDTGVVEYFTVEASDRFGDYGLIGVVGIEAGDCDTLRIETFALSCRALGRGIEHRMLAHVGDVGAARGKPHIDVLHRPTARNQPLLDFLEGVGGIRVPDPAGVRCRFAASALASLDYRPPAVTHSTVDSTSHRHVQDARDESRSSTRHPLSHLARTAVELNDPATVHAAIQDWRRRRPLSPAYVAPRTAVEERLARLWAEYLGLEQVGILDNFFDLGGHSMLAVQLMSKIGREFRVDLPLNALFGATTVSELAGVIEAMPAEHAPHRSRSDHPRLVAIQRSGSNPPFFCIHGIDGSVLGYYGLARQFGPAQPFYALSPAGLDDAAETPVDRVEDMAATYVDAIRSVHSGGAVFVGGWSFGAMVAFEVTRQLRDRGIDVARLVLLDGMAPVAREKRACFDERAAPLVRLFGGLLALIGEDLGRLHEEIVRLPEPRRWDRVLEMVEEETVGPLVSLLAGQQAVSLVNVRSAYAEISRLSPDDRLRYGLEKLIQAQAVPARTDVAYVARRLRVFKSNLKAMVTYVPAGSLSGVPCRFFAADDLFTEELGSLIGDRCWGWQEFIEEPIVAEPVGGNHYSMVMDPHAARLAERLSSWFERPLVGAGDAAAR